MSEFRSYRDLTAWQHGIDLVAEVYQLTRKLPAHEIYGLTSQMRRAAVSIPANLAEGHGRDSTREFLHHISIALGSLAELETHFLVSERLEYISKNDLLTVNEQCDRLGRIMRGLQKSLKLRLSDAPPPASRL